MHSEVILCSHINSINNYSPDKLVNKVFVPLQNWLQGHCSTEQIFGNIKRGRKNVSRRPVANTRTTTLSQMKLQAAAHTGDIK